MQMILKDWSLNDWGSLCSIISMLGLVLTAIQVWKMKKTTAACLDILKAVKDFDITYPLLDECIKRSNDNLCKVGEILGELKKSDITLSGYEDEIDALIKMNDSLRVDIERQMPDCAVQLKDANHFLREALKDDKYHTTSVESAQSRMEKSHEQLIAKQRDISAKKDQALVQAFGKN